MDHTTQKIVQVIVNNGMTTCEDGYSHPLRAVTGQEVVDILEGEKATRKKDYCWSTPETEKENHRGLRIGHACLGHGLRWVIQFIKGISISESRFCVFVPTEDLPDAPSWAEGLPDVQNLNKIKIAAEACSLPIRFFLLMTIKSSCAG